MESHMFGGDTSAVTATNKKTRQTPARRHFVVPSKFSPADSSEDKGSLARCFNITKHAKATTLTVSQEIATPPRVRRYNTLRTSVTATSEAPQKTDAANADVRLSNPWWRRIKKNRTKATMGKIRSIRAGLRAPRIGLLAAERLDL